MSEIEQAIEAACGADWMQGVLNQGPPCFHVEERGNFCLRAARWDGHRDPVVGHRYVSLADLLTALRHAHASEHCPDCGLRWTGTNVDCPACIAQGLAHAISALQPRAESAEADLTALRHAHAQVEQERDTLRDEIAEAREACPAVRMQDNFAA